MQKYHSIFDTPLMISDYKRKLSRIKRKCSHKLLSLNVSAKTRSILQKIPFPDEAYLDMMDGIMEKNIDSNRDKMMALYFSESIEGKRYREYIKKHNLMKQY